VNVIQFPFTHDAEEAHVAGVTEGFSIGVLASRTGVTPTVLRSWENRFGFPAGERSPAGHRRFSDTDVVLVQQMLEVRESGVPLQVAIDSVTRQRDDARHDSVYAALVGSFGDLRPQRLGRRTLMAASLAIEEECLARADRAVVLGAFQLGHNFARSRHRWDELSRTAAWAAVVADFDDALPPDAAARPVRCQLPDDSPMRREWTVVTISPTYAAVLAAWEVPVAKGRPEAYESVVSTHRPAVVAAARVITGVVRSAGVVPPVQVEHLLSDAAPRPSTSAADADRMWMRALTHLDPQR